MMFQLSRVHYPVTVLGPGRRIGIWFQGCSIRCEGCLSKDTWEADINTLVSVDMLMYWCQNFAKYGIDGITISGGEPFDQPDALEAILVRLKHWRKLSGMEFDILGYSGFSLTTLRQRHTSTLSHFDAIITEPYIESLPLGGRWRGSANQSIIPQTELGFERYRSELTVPPCNKGNLQLAVLDNAIWMIGIPDRGDMQQIECLASKKGLCIGGVSWR